MEYEVRFYYSKQDKVNLINKLRQIDNVNESERLYEKTTQYNSQLQNNDFYSKEIDGRYRVRITRGDKTSKCMLSWKKRLKDTTLDKVNKEEEIECRINPDDYENFIYILENINKMIRVESYERFRTCFYNNEIEISLDEYPFGIALEIEAKISEEPEKTIEKYVEKLNLKFSDSYKLSWDDKYEELCKNQGKQRKYDVLFNDVDMPEI